MYLWDNEIIDIAQSVYDTQLKAITNISHTEWYNEIKKYWERVEEGALDELKKVSKEKLESVQLKYEMANNFVSFLKNLQNAKNINNITKNL